MPAFAGLADTPIAAGMRYLYSVLAVQNVTAHATYFTCTSVSTSGLTVTIDAFDETGAMSGTASLIIGAGKSVTFGTKGGGSITTDASLGSGVIIAGAARILSDSKKVLCHAFVATLGTAPDTTLRFPLTIVAKLKQKAAN